MLASGLQPRSAGGAFAHQHHGGCAVVDGAAAGGGDGAVLLERGLERGNLVELDLAGAFVDADLHFAGTGLRP